MFLLGEQMLWVGWKVCFPSESVALPMEDKICSLCFCCWCYNSKFFIKNIWNHWTVILLEFWNAATNHFTSKPEMKATNIKGDYKSISLFLQVWKLAGKHRLFVSVYNGCLQYQSPFFSLWRSAHLLSTKSTNPFKRSKSALRVLHDIGLTHNPKLFRHKNLQRIFTHFNTTSLLVS